ncbi:MAG: hypothetical protein AAB316_24685, partial [Bacteroidota bacterium]
HAVPTERECRVGHVATNMSSLWDDRQASVEAVFFPNSTSVKREFEKETTGRMAMKMKAIKSLQAGMLRWSIPRRGGGRRVKNQRGI